MRCWRWFCFFFVVGFVFSVSVACTHSAEKSTTTTEAKTAVVSAETNKSLQAKPLPPETTAIIKNFQAKSAQAKNLYNPPRGDVRLVVISDLNSAYGSTDYDPEVDKGVNLVPFWQPDVVVCGGDMVAGQKPSLTPTQIRAMWSAFDEHVGAPLRRYKIPFGFTIGNHDASAAVNPNGKFLFQQERDLASEYWNNPKHDSGVKFVDRYEFPFYYTFESKDVFFLVWDGSSHRIPPEKMAWVEKSLASPRAQKAKMRIMVGHLPLYGVAVGRDQPVEVMADAEKLRAMFEKYKVHTYISGHHHAYYPGHRGDLQLLHTGILGSGPRPLINGNFPPTKTITVVDIKFDSPELTTYTTYDIKTLKLIENSQLPRFLTGHNGMVLRRDLELKDLTPQEKNSCIQTLDEKRCQT